MYERKVPSNGLYLIMVQPYYRFYITIYHWASFILYYVELFILWEQTIKKSILVTRRNSALIKYCSLKIYCLTETRLSEQRISITLHFDSVFAYWHKYTAYYFIRKSFIVPVIDGPARTSFFLRLRSFPPVTIRRQINAWMGWQSWLPMCARHCCRAK